MAAKLSGVAGQLQGRRKHLRTERQYCLEVQVGFKESGWVETLALLFTGCVTLGRFQTVSNPGLPFPRQLLCHHSHLCHHHDKDVSILCIRLRATRFLPIISFNPPKKLRRLVLLLPYVTNEETGTDVA